jgi:hypothetical protein
VVSLYSHPKLNIAMKKFLERIETPPVYQLGLELSPVAGDTEYQYVSQVNEV